METQTLWVQGTLELTQIRFWRQKSFALRKGPTLIKEIRLQASTLTSHDCLPWTSVYSVLKCSMILSLCLHLIICYLVLFMCAHHVYTQGGFLGAEPIAGECLNPTTGLCTWISTCLFDSDILETATVSSRLSFCLKCLFADKARKRHHNLSQALG